MELLLFHCMSLYIYPFVIYICSLYASCYVLFCVKLYLYVHMRGIGLLKFVNKLLLWYDHNTFVLAICNVFVRRMNLLCLSIMYRNNSVLFCSVIIVFLITAILSPIKISIIKKATQIQILNITEFCDKYLTNKQYNYGQYETF